MILNATIVIIIIVSNLLRNGIEYDVNKNRNLNHINLPKYSSVGKTGLGYTNQGGRIGRIKSFTRRAR